LEGGGEGLVGDSERWQLAASTAISRQSGSQR
jgi:hypothetical protein